MRASDPPTGLLSLPNEILLDIIVPLRTPALLPLTSVCRRLHDLAVRVLQRRFALAVAHTERLILECYPPSRKYLDSHMTGRYLGTDGLDDAAWRQGGASSLPERPPGERLRELNGLFSRYRPYRKSAGVKVVWKHPAGDIPGSRTFRPAGGGGDAAAGPSSQHPSQQPPVQPTGAQQTGTTVGSEELRLPAGEPSAVAEAGPSSSSSGGDARPQAPPAAEDAAPLHEVVTSLVHLEAGDLFTQLCANVNISIPGPRSGIFFGFQEVSKDGVIRVWRRWLAELAATAPAPAITTTPPPGAVRGGAPKTADTVCKDPSVLWINNDHHIGIRFTALEQRWKRDGEGRQGQEPLLRHVDEELPVTYQLRFEELLVRTRDLLLASESLLDQRFEESGKAIVFGNWLS